MPGPSRDVRMRLYRDSPVTPWGFRVIGGMDLDRPLTVQKTNLGSPADGELCGGDVILEIQDCDAATMTHQKVQELIKNSGGSLLLRVRRFVGRPDPYTDPKAQIETGISPGQSCIMMYRVQDTLANLNTGPSSSLLCDPSPAESAYHLHQVSHDRFYHRSPPAVTLACRGGKPQSFHDSLYSTLPRLKDLSQPPTGLQEPGWAPARPGTHQSTSRPTRAGRNPPPHPPAPSVRPPDRPAWEGSLRSSVDPRHPMDRRVQLSEIVRLHPEHPYSSSSSCGGWGTEGSSGPADALRLLSNSPVGLQTRRAENEAVFGQSKSEVYSLVVRQFERSRKAMAFDVCTDF